MDNDFSYDNVADGLQLVATPGTAEALASAETKIRAVLINALPENTGNVVVGASTVVASSGTRRGIALVPGGSVLLRVKNLADLYVDAVVANEGVSFVYFY